MAAALEMLVPCYENEDGRYLKVALLGGLHGYGEEEDPKNTG